MPSYDSTVDHSSNSNHSQSSILELRKLHFLLLLWISRVKSQRIKSKVTWLTVEVVHVGKGTPRACLQKRDPPKDLNHGFREFVMCIDNAGDSIEGKLSSRDAEEFRYNEANGRKHGNTAVLQFCLTEPRKIFRGTLLQNAISKEKQEQQYRLRILPSITNLPQASLGHCNNS